jgi:UDP-N-acetylmuramoyl-tripeptide--D-alanyl-D-alanine ligase
MENVTLSQIAQTLATPPGDTPDVGVAGVSTDSRTLREGELFVAIRGERFDGHDFVRDAFGRGAVAALVDTPPAAGTGGKPLFAVPNTVAALQRLAAWYRSRFDLPLVAVTGTNGKTTTKDMAASVLSTRLRTMKTEGNLNNHIGVPLTLLRLSSEHQAAVVEMGMNHPGEIERLAGMARPAIGVITNVAEAHMEGMGSLEAIAEAKGELLEALPPEGTAVLNGDDALVMSQAKRTSARVVTFGLSPDVNTRAVRISERGCVSFELDWGASVELPLPGRHNVMNALAALAVGEVLGIDREAAVEGLSSFEPSPMRMSVVTVGGWTILNDAYNANPGSLGAALESLVALANGRPTVAALGDMLELGSRARDAHREAGLLAAEKEIDHLLLFGKEVAALREGALAGGMQPGRARLFDDKAVLVEALRRLSEKSAVLLVKGSRAMRMEEVVELLAKGAPAS